jgi:hypothetical protein
MPKSNMSGIGDTDREVSKPIALEPITLVSSVPLPMYHPPPGEEIDWQGKKQDFNHRPLCLPPLGDFFFNDGLSMAAAHHLRSLQCG